MQVIEIYRELSEYIQIHPTKRHRIETRDCHIGIQDTHTITIQSKTRVLCMHMYTYLIHHSHSTLHSNVYKCCNIIIYMYIIYVYIHFSPLHSCDDIYIYKYIYATHTVHTIKKIEYAILRISINVC